jgi:nucleoside-diphosphate-sugar epimerase
MTHRQELTSGLLGRKFLITGASGFIGSNLCRRLCVSGAEVHAVSRAKRPTEENGVHWWHGDVTDDLAVTNLISSIKPEIIIHLAACVTGRRELEVVLPTLRDNLVSSVNLLTAAVTGGCSRIVLVGSLEEPHLDQGPPIPCSPYAASKWSASAYGRMFFQLYGLPVVIARLFMTYGPAQHDVEKLIPYVTLSLLRGTLPKLTDGSRLLDWIYIDDAVDGLLAISQTPAIEGYTIDLGSGVLVSVRAVVQQLVKLTGAQIHPLFGTLPERPNERICVADTASASVKIGWDAKTTLEEGLARTVAWYRDQFVLQSPLVGEKEEFR